MSSVIVNDKYCHDIAKAIRDKTGKQKKIKFSNFANEIMGISSENNLVQSDSCSIKLIGMALLENFIREQIETYRLENIPTLEFIEEEIES